MLRVNSETYDVYGFEGEGGYLRFDDVPPTYGEIILKVKGKELLEKRSLVFGEQSFAFVLTDDDMSKLGTGSFPYSVATIDENGHKNTFIPDLSTGLKPKFNIEEQ